MSSHNPQISFSSFNLQYRAKYYVFLSLMLLFLILVIILALALLYVLRLGRLGRRHGDDYSLNDSETYMTINPEGGVYSTKGISI